jgi:hypothetical protein
VDWVHGSQVNEWWILFRPPLLQTLSGRKKLFTQVTSRYGEEWDWFEQGQWEVRFPEP